VSGPEGESSRVERQKAERWVRCTENWVSLAMTLAFTTDGIANKNRKQSENGERRATWRSEDSGLVAQGVKSAKRKKSERTSRRGEGV